MDKRVRLVFAPGRLITLDALCPKSPLLMLQSRLFSEGVPSDIVDLGNLDLCQSEIDVVDEASEMVVSGWMEQFSQGLGGLPVLFQIKNTKNVPGKSAVSRKNLDAIGHGQPQMIVFWVNRRDNFQHVKWLSKVLKKQAPASHQILIGPYAVQYGTCILSDCPSIDGAVTGNIEESLLAILDDKRMSREWQDIPGILFRDEEGALQKTDAPKSVASKFPLCFSPFQKQESATQFAVFPLDFAVQPVTFHYQVQNKFLYKIKSASATVEEMSWLQRHYDARVFHIASPYVCPDELAEFADMLLTQNRIAIYSLGDVTVSISHALAERLFASGCRAIGFRVPTGSQRLLEDFYGCEASTSAMRASLRHCRKSGMFTVLKLSYPCPMDDYHTRAEIELLVESGRPDAVCIESPVVAPDSLWFKRASEFGFFINHKDYQRYIVGEKSAYGSLPYTMRGWNSRRMRQAQAAMATSIVKLGCAIDVTEEAGLLARLVRSDVDEKTFLEELRTAFESNNVAQLRRLAQCVNANAQTLQMSGMSSIEIPDKVASFS